MVDPHQSKAALSMGLALSSLTRLDLVVECAAIGDHITPGKLEAMLSTSTPRSDVEHDVVTCALNEHLADEGMDHPVPMSQELADPQVPTPNRLG